jgi:integrase/recombinase XerD
MSPLRKRMLDDMVVRNLAARTQESYLAAVVGLAKHYGRSPEQLCEAEVQRYLLYLIEERKLAWSSVNIACTAFKFVYRVTLKRRELDFAIPSPRQPQKLPQILSREEVGALIDGTINPRQRTILMTVYAAGLRVSEACHLRVRDIDSKRMSLRVEQGKRGKDRYTLLAVRLLAQLRRYWVLYQPRMWLFTDKSGQDAISDTTVQKMFYAAKRRAGITKACGIHGLRHAFATHLLEAGVDVRTIQRLMGHGHISTTMRYFHLAQKHLMGTPSPLDLLDPPKNESF